MDLRQQKLTAQEWDSLEIPVSGDEMKILKLIRGGYHDVTKSYNDTLSLMGFMRIRDNIALHHEYLYEKYFKQMLDQYSRKSECSHREDRPRSKKRVKKLKKADIIRVNNSDNKLAGIKDSIFEYIVLDKLRLFFAQGSGSRQASYHYYTLTQLMRFNITNFNTLVRRRVADILKHYEPKMRKAVFIENSHEFIERNPSLLHYRDVRLYEHQKQLFTICKNEGPKLILYQAPTGTGKTISPVGLSEGHRLIFVCVAKHVGLQLAKSCISLGIKIAVAFGCSDAGGVRLHYFAAKDYERNRRTGGIFRVDNSIGDDVQIMIADVQSYLPAMRYMLAFNDKKDLIWYWDEPTITLDYEDHEYHALLRDNWEKNEIPNVVLSSATLPKREEIGPCIQSHMSKFKSIEVYSIVSHDCTKTIPIVDSAGYVILPHLVFADYADVKKSLSHIENYKTLLRHLDLEEIVQFIVYVNKNVSLRERYQVENYFECIEDIDAVSLKMYYLKLLKAVKNDYVSLYAHFQRVRKKHHESNIFIATKDAHTLTDGPTIFLANDVKKIATFCFQTAKIPSTVLETLLVSITRNEKIRIEVEALERDLVKNDDTESNCSKRKGSLKSGQTRQIRKTKGDSDRETKEKCLQDKIDHLRGQVRTIQLASQFIPNSFEHRRQWNALEHRSAFTSSISDATVEKIMLLDVEPMWKVLLMMGVGVFADHKCVDYTTIMKNLAGQQKLYLIIASTDYIYGTNYQFCHGYIGKDLSVLSQEKTIQAFGRVGRSNAQQDYSLRLRNDDLIRKLFMEENNKIEVRNMNKLFGNT